MSQLFHINHLVFGSPYWLILLAALPFLLWRLHRQQKNNSPALQISTTQFVGSTARSWRIRVLQIFPLLQTIALCSLMIALARPQLKNVNQSNTNSGIDIVMSMDISGSMLATDFTPNRLEAAKKVASNFVKSRPYDRMGLVIFSGESFTQCPLTADHNILVRQVEAVQSGVLEDGTAIGMGLATAVDRLRSSDAKSKVVILLTDGVNNMGLIDPQTALEIAKAMKIKVYAIGVGTMGMARMPVGKNAFGEWIFDEQKVEIDEPLMQKIATETNGKYYRCTDNKALEKVYTEIDQLEKSKINIKTHVQIKELFYPFVLFGLMVFVALFIAKHTILRTIF
jgi:Ca-activated chloride channel homolog